MVSDASVSEVKSCRDSDMTAPNRAAQAAGEREAVRNTMSSMSNQRNSSILSCRPEKGVTYDMKPDGTMSMTISFPPDQLSEPSASGSGSSSKSVKRSIETEQNGQQKVQKKSDPSVLEIRLCDTDDDQDDVDALQVKPESVKSQSVHGKDVSSGQLVKEAAHVVAVAPSKRDEDQAAVCLGDDFTTQEINTMIQRCRVLIDFFAAGQMTFGGRFPNILLKDLTENIKSAAFFANSELNRLFKQVLLIDDVLNSFPILCETVATVFYTEEEIRKDFLPHRIVKVSLKAKAYLGQPLRHFRSFQRIFMLMSGITDPNVFDQTRMMRRVSCQLVRCRKAGYRSTKMMNNNRFANFKASPSTSTSPRTVTFGPTSYR